MGVFGYIIALGFAVYGRNTLSVRLRTWFETAPAQNLGLPSAAAAAFAIVAILLHAFPPLPDEHGVLAFKAFGLEFSGPSGPITLWLMCFMGFVFALKLLR
jgi:hypothetical protein